MRGARLSWQAKSFADASPIGEVGDSAANRGALVEVADRADPVITVCDNERKSTCQVATHEQNGRKRLGFLNSLQIFIHVGLVTREKGELRGAQQVLRGMFKQLRVTKALDERVGFPVGTQKRKEFERGLEIRAFLLLAPLECWLAHSLLLPSRRPLPSAKRTLSIAQCWTARDPERTLTT